jgi:hypothetical protein
MKSEKANLIKITADFVIDEYLKAKKLKGERKKNAMARVKFLSQNLNKFIPDKV